MVSQPFGTVLRQLRRMVDGKSDDTTSDHELVRRFVSERDEQAFVGLLERHGPMILGLCRRLQRNDHDAEDVFQATFLLLARKAGSIRKYEAVASWLYGVAQRLAAAARSQGARRQARERQAADMHKESASCHRSWQDLQAALEEALHEVPKAYRAPLLLCYLEGLTQEEAAQRLGCPLGTVRSRLARGRERLKMVLERKGVRLSATALAAALAGSSAGAALPPLLVAGTARAAVAYAAGASLTALVSRRVATLLEGGARTLGTTKLKIALALVLAASGLGIGMSAVGGRPVAAAPQRTVQADVPPHASVLALRAKAEAAQDADASDHRARSAVRGQVLDPAGQPLAGAKLYVSRGAPNFFFHEDLVLERVAVTDAAGRFDLDLRHAGKGWFYLVAHAAGYGVDWINLAEPRRPGDVTLNLVADVPITGRVVNTEGRGVAGVSVALQSLYAPGEEKLAGYLASWLTTTLPEYYHEMPRKRLVVPLDPVTGRVTTDQQGNFTLRGAGAERVAHIRFAGGGVGRSLQYVITRPGIDPAPYNEVLKKNKTSITMGRFYPPALTFVGGPARTVAGIVQDNVTGRPVPGCRVSAYTGFFDGISVLSDAEGRYRLEGLPRNVKGYTAVVKPSSSSAYLNRTARADDSAGPGPVKLDIGLARGVVVSGQVIDRQTGKGVSAGLRLAPLPGNRLAEEGAEYSTNRTGTGTDTDGNFRVLAVPGRILVMAQALITEEEPLCPYRRARPDPNHKSLFTYDKDDDSWVIQTIASLEFLGVEHAVKVLDIKEQGETRVVLQLDRGGTARLAIQDSAGKPLPGAWVAGLTDYVPSPRQVRAATSVVLALDPEKPRKLAIYHPDKQVGGAVTIRGDEQDPVVVKLGPLASVTGRLVDSAGGPLVGAAVTLGAPGPAGEMYRAAETSTARGVTDKGGRFTLPGVVPGAAFYLQTRLGDRWYRGRPKIGHLQANMGQTIELGTRTMEALEPE